MSKDTHDILSILFHETHQLSCRESEINRDDALPVVLKILTDNGVLTARVDQIRVEPVSKPCHHCKHDPKTKGLVLHASI